MFAIPMNVVIEMHNYFNIDNFKLFDDVGYQTFFSLFNLPKLQLQM